MSRTACIRHPANAPLIKIHQWQRDLFRGDKCKAALLSLFEYWHGVKLSITDSQREEDLYHWNTQLEIEDALMGIAKTRRIREATKELEKEGFIKVRQPSSRDRVYQYFFKVEPVQEWVDYWDEVYQEHRKSEFGKNKICIPPNLQNPCISTNRQKRIVQPAKTHSPTGKNANHTEITSIDFPQRFPEIWNSGSRASADRDEESFSDVANESSGAVSVSADIPQEPTSAFGYVQKEAVCDLISTTDPVDPELYPDAKGDCSDIPDYPDSHPLPIGSDPNNFYAGYGQELKVARLRGETHEAQGESDNSRPFPMPEDATEENLIDFGLTIQKELPRRGWKFGDDIGFDPSTGVLDFPAKEQVNSLQRHRYSQALSGAIRTAQMYILENEWISGITIEDGYIDHDRLFPEPIPLEEALQKQGEYPFKKLVALAMADEYDLFDATELNGVLHEAFCDRWHELNT